MLCSVTVQRLSQLALCLLKEMKRDMLLQGRDVMRDEAASVSHLLVLDS
jgi:hypothetical protein